MPAVTRPQPGEYLPYYHRYISLVPEGDVCDLLESQIGETRELLRSIPEARAGHRYAEGKWSIREAVCHLADTERVMAYRALRAARGDATPIPGYDQDAWAPASGADARTLASVADEYAAVRGATVHLLRSLTPETAARRVTANDAEISARALAYIIAGHELHHRALLRSHYLAKSFRVA
jgi:hypothetical protein